MYSNWLILILFGISWNFPNLVTFGGSGVPFAFIFPSLLVIPNFFIDLIIHKKKINIKIVILLSVLIFTIIFSAYSFQIDQREYLIRLLQIFSAFVVYVYVRNNFYLNTDPIKALKIIIILQLPSFVYGLLEVINFLIDLNNLENFLVLVRTITAQGRADVVRMNTITLHFFEHSMAAFYFVSIAAIILIIYFNDKKLLNNSNKLYSLSILLFIILFFFHRSTTFFLLLIVFSFLIIISLRSVKYGILTLLLVSLGIFLSGTIMYKITSILDGSIMASDLFRFTSIMTGMWNFIENPLLGTGPGTWSKNYLDGLNNILNTISFSEEFKNLILLNVYVGSFETGEKRVPLNSAYMALLSEYGLIFLVFIFLFHGKAFTMKTNLNIVEMTIIAGMFLGYPLAYPYFWFTLGFIHSQNYIKKHIRLKRK